MTFIQKFGSFVGEGDSLTCEAQGFTVTARIVRDMAASPMTPKRNPNAPQKQCDHGLFDEVGRAQTDLCDLIAQANKETEL